MNDILPSYGVVWKPPAILFSQQQQLKAIFSLGAGVDHILSLGSALPKHVPIIRLEDAGMAKQMAEYVSYAVLRYQRRFDEAEKNAQQKIWNIPKPYRKQDFTVGIMGLGVLGLEVAKALLHLGFPVRGWSRTAKNVPNVQTFTGEGELNAFLQGTRVLVALLPLTHATANILNKTNLSQLQQGAYLINIARGELLVENDFFELIKSGHIASAMLDVVRQEPLPKEHPFWTEPKITITPHFAALTLLEESVKQIAHKMAALERGENISGIINRQTGY